jgi:hypothetical protein
MRIPSARPSVCDKKNSPPNRRGASKARLRQRDRTRCGSAPWRCGLDQKRRIERVQLCRRVLWCLKSCRGNVRERNYFGRRKMIYDGRDWNIQNGMLRWQDARRLRRNHRLAAIVRLIGRIARHRAAALHRLLVGGYGGQTVRKLQDKERSERQNQECHPANHVIRLYGD